MARIKPIEINQATSAQREQFDDQIAHNGRITNMKRTLLHSLPAFHALMEWYPLRDAAHAFLSDMEINVFCHAISTQSNCLICSTFFRKILIDNGRNPDELELSETESLLAEFGQRCVADANGIDEGLFARLRERYNDEQIVILTSFAGLMIATNLINNALQVDLDEYLTDYAKDKR